ncbi:hypothetical protein LguiA_002733 [Lonicera macranthoides]
MAFVASGAPRHFFAISSPMVSSSRVINAPPVAKAFCLNMDQILSSKSNSRQCESCILVMDAAPCL